MITYLLSKQLPKEFQQVEYIQSSGTQYIDTNYYPTNNTSIEMKIRPLAVTNRNYCIFSGRTDYALSTYSLFFLVYQNNVGRFDYGNTQNQLSSFNFNNLVNTDVEISAIKNKCYINGTLQATGASTATFIADMSTTLGASKAAGGMNIDNFANMRIYSCKIYTNDSLVRNFIPCYRKLDNEIGLYDTVNDIFYTNAGTGTFTKGSDATLYDKKKVSTYLLKRIVPVPAEYQPVEYLESAGMQYIDTGYKVKANTDIEITFNNAGNVTEPFGVVNNNNIAFVNTISYFRLFGTVGLTVGATGMGVYRTRGVIVYKDDVPIMTCAGTPQDLLDRNLYLFARNTQNGITYGNAAIYHFKIFENDVLIYDYVPCYRKADNKPGLYDTINDVFYTNANTSATQDFTVGSNIDPFIKQKVAVKLLCSEVPSEYQQVEYLESLPNQGHYIDTGYIPNTTTRIELYGQYTERLDSAQGIPANHRSAFGSGANTQGFYFGVADQNLWTPIQGDLNYHKFFIDFVAWTYGFDDNIYNKTPATYTPVNPFWVFCRYGNTTGTNKVNFKCYNLKFFESGTLVHNYTPCYRKADNKPGLYDTVNGVFYTNANTSATQDFTVGSNKWIIK